MKKVLIKPLYNENLKIICVFSYAALRFKRFPALTQNLIYICSEFLDSSLHFVSHSWRWTLQTKLVFLSGAICRISDWISLFFCPLVCFSFLNKLFIAPSRLFWFLQLFRFFRWGKKKHFLLKLYPKMNRL